MKKKLVKTLHCVGRIQSLITILMAYTGDYELSFNKRQVFWRLGWQILCPSNTPDPTENVAINKTISY